MVKNIVVKLLLFRETFAEKYEMLLVERDVQWKFYA